jgi:peptide subunit release factor RF-3
MNYTQTCKAVEQELEQMEEEGRVQRFKDILRKEDIDLFY